jgi:TIR domain
MAEWGNKHAFVSYVHEDAEQVDALCAVLEAAEIPYWRDRTSLAPGDAWKTKIRQAIQTGALVFLACFSGRSRARVKTHMNEELTLAAEEFRKMPPGRTWLIPVRFDAGDVPAWDLGGGRTLDDLNYVDLFGPNYAANAAKLMITIHQVMGEKPLGPAAALASVEQAASTDRIVPSIAGAPGPVGNLSNADDHLLQLDQVAEASTETVAEPETLARRLRDLRLHRWSDAVRQRTLAQALGGGKPLSASLISAWESDSNPTLPPTSRLRDYATFFATSRSVEDGRGRLLRENELNAEELAARDHLYDELSRLRRVPAARRTNEQTREAGRGLSWEFPTGAHIYIVSAPLNDLSHPYADPAAENYNDLLTFADVDALVELFGHIRLLNPAADVRFLRADRLFNDLQSSDVLSENLVLLGNTGLTDGVLNISKFPIVQRPYRIITAEGEVFEDADGALYLPTMSEHNALVEDVGLLGQMPNPYNSSATITLCSGVFSVGVVGATRVLTDEKLRGQNAAYLDSRFAGANRSAILFRVPVLLGVALTPNLSIPGTSLYEWRDD